MLESVAQIPVQILREVLYRTYVGPNTWVVVTHNLLTLVMYLYR